MARRGREKKSEEMKNCSVFVWYFGLQHKRSTGAKKWKWIQINVQDKHYIIMWDLYANQKSGKYTLPFLYFFFSLTLLSIRIISQFFNLAFKILLIQVYLRSGYSPHCFVAVVLPLLVLDGYPVLDVNDHVAGCSCVNILK